MTTKKKKTNYKARGRLCIAFVLFSIVVLTLSYNFFDNINQIIKMKQEKKQLEERLVKLQDEEEELETDIQKLEDPTYVARYAREKYLYSKDGELIIRIDE